MQDRWGETPFVALTASLGGGIAASALIGRYCFAALAIAAGVLAGAALLAHYRGRFRTCLALGLCTIALDGILLGLGDRDGYASDDVRSLVARGSLPLSTPVFLDGCVLEDSSQRGTDMVSTIELHGFRQKESWLAGRGKVQIRMALPTDPQVPRADLRYGDRLRAWMECDGPRNFQNPGSPDRVGFLGRQGIHLLARIRSPRLMEILPRDCGTPWNQAVASVRRSLMWNLENFAGQGNTQQAAVLSSIVLGDYADLGTVTRAEFQNAGTYHVLVVSGLHVSWIAWVLIRALRLLRLPAAAGRLLAACGILFYTGLVGFQASISRALWMFALYLAGQSLFRKASPANLIMACAFLLLVARPGWLSDAGFQLSFLSVAAIVLTALPIIGRVLVPMLNPLRHAGKADRLFLAAGKWHSCGRRLRFRAEVSAEACADRLHAGLERIALAGLRLAAVLALSVGSMILISLSVQIWLEPVLAYYFNRLSWIAPAANLAVVPLSSAVLAAGMTAEAVTSLIPSAQPLFRVAGGVSSLLLRTNQWFSSLPGAWQRCPTPPASWVLAGLLLVFVWCFFQWRRLWIPCAVVGLELAALSLAGTGILPHRGAALVPGARRFEGGGSMPVLRLTFLDVGQGDSAVIEFPDGRVWVIDAGGLRMDPSQPDGISTFDIGEAVVSRFLWSRWIARLDRVLLTHPHQDHAGGMPALLQNFPARRLDYGDPGEEPVLARTLEAARSARVPAHPAVAGEETRIGGVAIRTLNPPRQSSVRSLNDISVVLRLEYGCFSAILAGDMEGTGETGLVATGQELHGTLLKVAHHGSRNATLDPFLERVRPRWAIISAGRKNQFQNPARETLLHLLRHGAGLLLTMDQGAVCLETDGYSYRLSSYALGILEEGALNSCGPLDADSKASGAGSQARIRPPGFKTHEIPGSGTGPRHELGHVAQ